MAKKLSIPVPRVTAQKQQALFAEAANPLITLETIELEGATLLELGEIVQTAHTAFEAHLGSALQAGLIAGRALLVAKEKFTYDRQTGGFRGWLVELAISKSSAYRYMNLAKHDQIVSQAGTLSEAMALLSQYRSEQRALRAVNPVPVLKKRRMTVTLTVERDHQLESIAQARGVEVSGLMSEIIEQWLVSQEDVSH